MAKRTKSTKSNSKPKLRLVDKSNNKQTATEIAYFKDLHRMLDQIFADAVKLHEWGWSELAEAAGLNYMTVNNLGNRLTKWPRHFTVYKLARAVGCDLALEKPAKTRTLPKKKKAA